MNLEDLISIDTGLQQDEWTLTYPVFGKEGQIRVIGWSGRYQGAKVYIVKCSICERDSELHGDGHFKTNRASLKRGGIPCACSKSYRWSEQQYETLCLRKAQAKGYNFVGFKNSTFYKNVHLVLECSKHGIWDTTVLQSFLSADTGCPSCKGDKTAERCLKNDEEMINSFMSSGCFSEGTRFWRIDRKDSKNRRVYWKTLCGDCKKAGEATASDLRNGNRQCDCTNRNPKQAYINLILEDDSIMAIKFGITIEANRRARQQNRKAKLNVYNYMIFEFNDPIDCRQAETQCKKELLCGVVDKGLMPDGWSETTALENISKVIEIYQRKGGIPINSNLDRPKLSESQKKVVDDNYRELYRILEEEDD